LENLPNISRDKKQIKKRGTENVARVRNEKRVKNKVENCEGERPVGRSKRRRRNVIEWDVTE